jgi:hypothetical protein
MTITQIASLPCNELRSSKTWIRVKREERWKMRSIERQHLCAIKHLAVDTDLGKQEVQATLAETLRKGRDAPIPAIPVWGSLRFKSKPTSGRFGAFTSRTAPYRARRHPGGVAAQARTGRRRAMSHAAELRRLEVYDRLRKRRRRC